PQHHCGLALVENRIAIGANRTRVVGVRVPARYGGVRASPVPVGDDGQAVRVLVPCQGAAGQIAVGGDVGVATQIAHCCVIHLGQVVVRLERGHSRVDLAETVQIIDDAAVADGAATAVRRVVARTHAGGSRRAVGAVGIVDDLAGNRIP